MWIIENTPVNRKGNTERGIGSLLDEFFFFSFFFFFTRVFCFVPWHRNVNVSWINWCWWQFHDWCYMKALWSQYLESGITIESFVSVRILHNHSSNSIKEWMNEWMNGTGEYLEHWLEVTKTLEIFKIC